MRRPPSYGISQEALALAALFCGSASLRLLPLCEGGHGLKLMVSPGLLSPGTAAMLVIFRSPATLGGQLRARAEGEATFFDTSQTETK